MTISFALTRFTYAPGELCLTADAAIATRSPIKWISYNPQAALSLHIDQQPDKILMICRDGEDACRTWDLSEIKSEAENAPGFPVVIVKFPNIVFRWYNHRERILHRIQFKLVLQHEFTTLTDFCVKYLGSVRDLHGKSGSSTNSTPTLGFMGLNSSPAAPVISPSQDPSCSQQTWIPSSSQIQRLSQKLPLIQEPPSKEKQTTTKGKGKGTQKRNTDKSAAGERVLKRVRKEQNEWDGVMSEEMMWGLLEDDAFVAEVEQIGEIWKKMGLNDRIFAHEK